MNTIEEIFGASASSSQVSAPKKELGQADFLKLLVAQMKNQDPSSPADNGEFLGQIAQFSMVDGIDELGVSFDGIAGSLYTNQAMQAAQLIGKEALIETDRGVLEADESIEGLLELEEDVHEVRLQVLDASGSLVSVINLGNVRAGMQSFSWNGVNQDGELSAPGEYIIRAEGLVNGELEGLPLHMFTDVESVSVDRNNTNVLLHLANDSSVGFSQIREYR